MMINQRFQEQGRNSGNPKYYHEYKFFTDYYFFREKGRKTKIIEQKKEVETIRQKHDHSLLDHFTHTHSFETRNKS